MKERIGLIGDNSKEYVDCLIDIWNHNDCAVLIDWRIPLNSAIEMMKEALVKRCYIEESIFDKYNTENSELDFIKFRVENKGPELLPQSIYDKFLINYSLDEAVILYSSGTTGKAKGIILSQFSINTNADAIIDYMNLNANDCMYIVKALAHSSTLVGELLVCLKKQISMVISSTVVPPRYSLNNISKFSATILCVNPTLLNLFALSEKNRKNNFTYLKTIYTSGAITEKRLLELSGKVFINTKILNVYGLSEAGPRITAQIEEDNITCNSVGKEINGVRLKIIKQNRCEADEYEKGIIHVKTPSVFSGYVSGIAKNMSLYEDWLNTGDIGHLDSHRNLYISGRIDNMIVVGSHNVYLEEIEESILGFDEVRNCIVTSEKDEIYGDKIVCIYVADIQESALMRYLCATKLATYEIPQKYIKVGRIKETPNGKKIRDIKAYL